MHSKTLANWRAKRAGGRITIYGDCQQTKKLTKIVGVDTITPGLVAEKCCHALDRDGVTHTLLLK